MKDKDKTKNVISRRDFMKRLGLATAAVTGLSSITSCKKEGQAPAGEMTYRTNPTTGDKVSLLGFGMMRLPSQAGGSAREGGAIDQEMANRMVKYAFDHGVNYYDTSPAYCKGRSEAATGIALKQLPRDKVYVATKLSNFARETWTYEASVQMYHDSMKELQVDYIDYYLLHGIGMGSDGDGYEELFERYINNGVLDFLLEERKAGRIRNLGFSYHGDIRAFDYLLANHDKYKWDFVQIQLNYVDWQHAKEINERNTNAEYLYNELAKRNIPAVVMEPLLGGRLSNVPDGIFKSFKEREPEMSAAAWAFRFAGGLPGILTVLSGMAKMSHLEENIRTFSPLKPLTADEQKFLQEVARRIAGSDIIPCTNCKYCMPCPFGLNIPGIFMHYNKCVNDGDVPQSTRDPNYRSARRAFLVGYDRSIPRVRQADHCIGCGYCTPHCPQRIHIPNEMQRISAYVNELKANP